MKIVLKNTFFIISILLLFVSGLYMTTTVFAACTSADIAAGYAELSDGSCVPHGTVENTLARGQTALGLFSGIVNILITIVVSLAFLYFFWNLAKYIKAAEPDGKEEAKGKMLWALVAIFVIASLWGIIAFIGRGLGVGSNDPAPLIQLPAVGFSEVYSVERNISILNDFVTVREGNCPITNNPSCYKPIAPILKEYGKASAEVEKIRKNEELTEAEHATVKAEATALLNALKN